MVCVEGTTSWNTYQENQCTQTKHKLTMEECRDLTQFKQDTSRVVLTVVNVVAMVIMDKQTYTNKAHSLLVDTNTYRILNKDTTNKLKNNLIQTLKDINKSGGLSNQKDKKLYPTTAVPQSFMTSLKSIMLAPPKAHSVQEGPIDMPISFWGT